MENIKTIPFFSNIGWHKRQRYLINGCGPPQGLDIGIELVQCSPMFCWDKRSPTRRAKKKIKIKEKSGERRGKRLTHFGLGYEDHHTSLSKSRDQSSHLFE